MRLIDADAFENYVYDEWLKNEISNGDWIQFGEWLKDQKTVVEFDDEITKVVVKGVEYVPSAEKHGRWKIKTINTFNLAYGSTGYEPVYECSVCGRVEESYLRLDEPIMPEDADFPNYCPHCGADMREREEE